jgi:hypothetical protein
LEKKRKGKKMDNLLDAYTTSDDDGEELEDEKGAELVALASATAVPPERHLKRNRAEEISDYISVSAIVDSKAQGDEKEDEGSAGKRLRTEARSTTTAAQRRSSKLVSLPPPPADLLGLEATTRGSDSKAHLGRIRTFPHIEGNYPTFVYIPGTIYL